MNYSKIKATWWAGTIYHKEQLDEVLSSTDIRTYAYILHDKDIDKDTGELKKPHYHYLIQFIGQQRGSWFKQFYADDKGHILHRACYAPEGAYNYLIHDTPACRKEGKYLYDRSERIGTIDSLDTPDTKERKINLAKVRDLILCDNVKPDEIVLKYEVNEQLAKTAERLYVAHKNAQFDNIFREVETTFIWGDSGIGKTRYVTGLYGFKGVYKNSGFAVRGWFDDYDYQDVLLIDEYDEQWAMSYLMDVLYGQPYKLGCRYHNKLPCYTKVYITSNSSLDSLYIEEQHKKPKLWQGLMRRINYVWHLGAQFERQLNPHYEKNIGKKALQTVMPDDGDLPY